MEAVLEPSQSPKVRLDLLGRGAGKHERLCLPCALGARIDFHPSVCTMRDRGAEWCASIIPPVVGAGHRGGARAQLRPRGPPAPSSISELEGLLCLGCIALRRRALREWRQSHRGRTGGRLGWISRGDRRRASVSRRRLRGVGLRVGRERRVETGSKCRRSVVGTRSQTRGGSCATRNTRVGALLGSPVTICCRSSVEHAD